MMKTATLSACCTVALIGILALTTAVPVDRESIRDNQLKDDIIAKIDSVRAGTLDILRAKRDVSQLGETEVIGLRLIKDTPEDVYRFLNQRANLLEEERRKRQACNCSLAAHSAQAYGGHQVPLSLQFTTTVDVVGENLFQQPQYQGQGSQYELSQGQNSQSQYDQYAIIDGPTPEPLGLAVPLEKVPARKSSAAGRAQAQTQSGAVQFDQFSFVNGPVPQPLGLAVPLDKVPARNPSVGRAQAQAQSGLNQFDQFSIINGPIPKPLGLAVPLEKVPPRQSSVSATSQASGYHALLRGPLQTTVQEGALSYLLTTQTQRRFFNVNYNYNLALAYQTQLDIQKNSLARRSIVTNPNGISCADVCDCAGAGFGTLGICTPKYCQCDPNTQQPLNFKCEGDQVFDPFNLRCDYPANIALCSDAAGAVVHDESIVGSQPSLSAGGPIVFDEQTNNAAGAQTHGSYSASAAVHGDSAIENHGGFSAGDRIVTDVQSQAGTVAEAQGSYAHQSYSHQSVQQGGSTEQHSSSIQFPQNQQANYGAAAVEQQASAQVQLSSGQTDSNVYDSTSQAAAVEQPAAYDYSAQTTTGDIQAQSGHSAQVHSTVQYDGTASQYAQSQVVSSPTGGAIQFNEENQNSGGQAYDQSYVQIGSAQQSGYDQSSGQGASGQQSAYDGQAAEGQQSTYDYSGQSAYDQSSAQAAAEQQSAYDQTSVQAAGEQQSAYDQSTAQGATEQQSAYDQTAAQVATEQQSAYDQSSAQPSSDQQSSYDYSSAQAASGSQQYDQSAQVQSTQQAEYDQTVQAQTAQESGYEQSAQVAQQEQNYGAAEHSSVGQISATVTNHGENHNGAQHQVAVQQQVTQQSYEQIPAQVTSVQHYEYATQEGHSTGHDSSQGQQAAHVDSQQHVAVDNAAYQTQQAVSGNQGSIVASAVQGGAYGSSTGQTAHVQIAAGQPSAGSHSGNVVHQQVDHSGSSTGQTAHVQSAAGQHSAGSHSGTVVHQQVGHSGSVTHQVSQAGAVTQGASHSSASAAHQASHSGGAAQHVSLSGGAVQQGPHSGAAAQQISEAGSHHQSSGVGNLGHQQASHSTVVYTPTVHGSTQSLSSHQGSAIHSAGSAFHRLGSYAGSPLDDGDIQVVVLQPQQGLHGTVIQTYQQPAIQSQVYTSGYQIAPVVSAGQPSDAVVIEAGGSSIQQLVGQNVGQATRIQGGRPENYDVGVVVLSSDSNGAIRTPAILQTPDSIVVQSTANNIAGHSAASGHQGENGYAYNTPSIKYSESSAGAQRTGHSYSSNSFQSNYGRSVSGSGAGGDDVWVWKSGQPKQIQTNAIHHYA